jgi:rod shape determining protein RodA
MKKRNWRNFDFLLLAVTIAVVGIGIALIYSATISAEADSPLLERSFVRQALFAISGLFILVLAAAADYRFWGRIHRLLYVAAIVALSMVAVWGQASFGAQSWLSLRWGIQPSELAKVLLIVFLAKYLADHEEELGQIRWFLLSLVLVAPVVYLVYRQPDMGSAMVFGVIWLGLVFAAGMRLWQMGLFSLAIAGAVPVSWLLMKDYMQERILVFLNPASDVSGISYNSRQALISIGSGGWFGKGFLHGTQSQLYFLRVRHTDYIFSVLCEELGFVGALVLLVLLVVLLWRILRVASMAADPLGRLLACGVATMIFFQSVVNIAVNVGLLPVTGLTLPLVSYGGSSLWATLLGIGLVESVAMRHKKLEFGD